MPDNHCPLRYAFGQFFMVIFVRLGMRCAIYHKTDMEITQILAVYFSNAGHFNRICVVLKGKARH